MKIIRPFLAAVSFGAGLSGVLLCPPPAGSGNLTDFRRALGKNPSPVSNGNGGQSGRHDPPPGGTAAADPAQPPAAALKGPGPSMDEVFDATGLDRMLLMARFIQTATPVELEEAVKRCERERIHGPTFEDQLWLRWVEVDREAALRHQPRANVWWALTKLDADDALAEAMKSGSRALETVLFSIAQGNPGRARELLTEHPEVNSGQVESGMLEELTETDAPAAMALALKMEGDSAETWFKKWIVRDREQAIAWMNGLTDPGQRRRMEDTAVSELIASDPAAGLEASRKLPPGLRQLTRTVEAIGALARQNPEAARAAAQALPSMAGRQQALAAMAGALVSSDPASAVSMLTELDWTQLRDLKQAEWSYEGPPGTSSGGYNGNNRAGDLIRSFMRESPQATADALAALPAALGAPVGEAVKTWAGQQHEAASSWLKELPDGFAKDQAIQGLSQWLVQESPEPDYAAALAWAAAASAEMRGTLMESTLDAWQLHDPQAAGAAVDALPVTEERKMELLRRLGLSPQ